MSERRLIQKNRGYATMTSRQLKQRVTTPKSLISTLALALGLAVAAAPTAAMAKSRAAQARAQATEDVMEGGVSPERVRALRECNARIARFRGYNALSTPTGLYKTCMADHGQPE
ncbi:hypothetical protein [Rhodoplanes sp. Z2-YC6860]|uniref:hypothetical protein n=1 Tax=Rhodoplanes sp. Z2-YC6860 TaxID=674703 RepID=UPI00082CE4EC|nr:hypothetical protein [Rhodoplanes sp. Z2-YC6860]